ncbi:MAG: thioredoxin fold domain-containing protein [Candidatus Cloacimonetes bacterium]|jgi:thioredoxin|nr:thioredoxin fold domain-containing protein [Candidatus Cloacimonadota bacterium]
MDKRVIFITVLAIIISSCLAGGEKTIKLEHLNMETFKQNIFDFEKNREWKYEGELPAIIDFYADWCAPCKRVAPIMIELSEEYKDKIVIYKINTEDQRELASMFGIRSIPSILFIPVEGKPQMLTGALPKETFKEAIEDILKVK